VEQLQHLSLTIGGDQIVALVLLGFGLFLAGVQVSRRTRRDP